MKMKLMKNTKYSQQEFSWKVFEPETATDFTFRVNKSYVPFTCKFHIVTLHFCADSSQVLQVKNYFFSVFSYD